MLGPDSRSLLERNCSCFQLPAKIQTSSDWLSFELNCCLAISIKRANDLQSSYGWSGLPEPPTGLAPYLSRAAKDLASTA